LKERVTKLEEREPRGCDKRKERDESRLRNRRNEEKDNDRDKSRIRNRRDDRDREDDTLPLRLKSNFLLLMVHMTLKFFLTGYHG